MAGRAPVDLLRSEELLRKVRPGIALQPAATARSR
jgi:hypothetical protein